MFDWLLLSWSLQATILRNPSLPFAHALASRAHVLVQIFLRTLIIGMRHQTSPLRFYKYNRPVYVYVMIVAAIKLLRNQSLQIW
jgi:hypothetical protein